MDSQGLRADLPYKNAILGVGLLVIVLVIALSLWHSHSVAQASEAWNSLGIPVFQPVSPTSRRLAYAAAVQTYPGTPAAEWAEVFAGDTALMIGTNKILTDKKVGHRIPDSMLKTAIPRR